MTQVKTKVGAKPKYKKQPRQMNVRFVEDADKVKIKAIERKLLESHKVKK